MTPRLTLSAALLAAAMAAILAVSACGLGNPDSVISAGSMTTPSTMSPSGTANSSGPTSTQPAADRASLSPAEAASAAAGRHTGSAVVSIELDRAHGTTVWEVTVVATDGRWKVDVDVSDGSVLGDKADDPEDAAADRDLLSRAALDHAAAIEAALATHPGSTLAEIDLDEEGGAVVWEAEVVTPEHQKFDVTIDASSGAVLTDTPDN